MRAVALLLLLVSPALADLRTWTDSTGKFHTEATLADYQGDVAYLKKSDGQITPLPLTKLSEADRQYIKATTPGIKTITGKVIAIADGDTLTVIEGSTAHRVRLQSIDSPEDGQEFGAESRKSLLDKVYGKVVTVDWRERDQEHRILGQVFLEGRWINKGMIDDGWAWHYREYSKSEVLQRAEDGARAKGVGIWAAKNPAPPWEYRHPVAVTLGRMAKAKPEPKPAKESDSPADSQIPSGEAVTGHTATGIPIHTGPRGGRYHYSKNGNKVYERKKP